MNGKGDKWRGGWNHKYADNFDSIFKKKKVMKKIYIFDVDGTLTPSRQKMTEEFAKFFDEWSSKNTYYLVTGSDLKKTKEQLPIAYIDRAKAIFTCCGNEMWEDGKQIYRKKFKPPKELIKYLEEQLETSEYPVRAGNHIEDRGTLLNFSIVGRDCSLEERLKYHEYDIENKERKIISKYIRKHWKELEAVIGGQISIDIYPMGNNKSQTLKHIYKKHISSKIIFIGDGIENNGNDYPLAQLMGNVDGCYSYHTKGWEQTKQILESLND